MAFFTNINQYYFLCTITRKMEVQKDILRFFCVSVTYFNPIAKFDYNFFELNFHYIIVNRHNKGIFAVILTLQLEGNLHEKYYKDQLNQIKIRTNSFFLFNQRNLIRKMFVNRIRDCADLYGEITNLKKLTKRYDKKIPDTFFQGI